MQFMAVVRCRIFHVILLCPRIAAEEQDYRPGILFHENMCAKSDAFCVALPQNAKFFFVHVNFS
jgi:hypothetical protein